MSETPKQERVCSCWLGSPGATFGSSVERQACAVHGDGAPASSGPAALVERLRYCADSPCVDEPALRDLMREAADALVALVEDRDRWRISSNHYGEKLTARPSASPAPACASCAEKDAEIGKMARALLRLKRGECWCEMGVGNPNMTSHSSACKTVTAILHGQ